MPSEVEPGEQPRIGEVNGSYADVKAVWESFFSPTCRFSPLFRQASLVILDTDFEKANARFFHNSGNMSTYLLSQLGKLHPTGYDGFEGLVRLLLEALTGTRFLLARSGSQFGRDLTSHAQATVVAVECKRYSTSSPKPKDLVYGLTEAMRSRKDLDLWVLAVSRPVPSQLDDLLRDTASEKGVEYRALSAGDGDPSSIETFCARFAGKTLDFLRHQLPEIDQGRIARELEEIRSRPDFQMVVKMLRQWFSPAAIGYDSFRKNQNQWLLGCFRSVADSRAHLGQNLHVARQENPPIERRDVLHELNEWIANWPDSQTPFALLGDEGDGKTWAAAAWLAKRLQSQAPTSPILFIPSRDASSENPRKLVAATICRGPTKRGRAFWRRKLLRWLERQSESAPVLLLVLDGINERKTPSFWRSLVQKLNGDRWRGRVAVLLTCRKKYWEQHFKAVIPAAKTCEVLPYNDHEFRQALQQAKISPLNLPQALQGSDLIRKPRFFDLMLQHRERVDEWGELTKARLFYEDWKDRVTRKGKVELTDGHFKELIQALTKEHSKSRKWLDDAALKECLPPFLEGRALLELEDEGVLVRRHGLSQVKEELLPTALGMLLATDVAREFTLDPSKNLEELVKRQLEPYAGTDLESEICETAVLHSLSQSDFGREIRMSLLASWAVCKNFGHDAEGRFSAYLVLDPKSYLELGPRLWRDDSSSGRYLFTEALVQNLRTDALSPELPGAFEKWLGFIDLDGYPIQWGRDDSKREMVRNQIERRIGSKACQGAIQVAGVELTVIEGDLWGLRSLTMALMTHFPRQRFLRALMIGCIADSVMGWPSMLRPMAWVLGSSNEPLWEAIEKEVDWLLQQGGEVARAAAGQLLFCYGTPAARKKLEQEGLSCPKLQDPWQDTLEERLRSPFSWTREDCDIFPHREEPSDRDIALGLSPYSTDPSLQLPAGFEERLSRQIEETGIEDLWSARPPTSAEHELSHIVPAACRWAPKSLQRLFERIFESLSETAAEEIRQPPANPTYACYRLSRQLNQHELMLSREHREESARLGLALSSSAGEQIDLNDRSERYFFEFAAPALETEEQLEWLVDSPAKSLDNFSLERVFKPISDWDAFEALLHRSLESERCWTALWFASKHPGAIPQKILAEITGLVTHENSTVRWLALQILFNSGSEEIARAFVRSDWGWRNTQAKYEWQFGSLILGKFGQELLFSEIEDRVHRSWLGYAVEKRGGRPEEVDRYGDLIHQAWKQLKHPASPEAKGSKSRQEALDWLGQDFFVNAFAQVAERRKDLADEWRSEIKKAPQPYHLLHSAEQFYRVLSIFLIDHCPPQGVDLYRSIQSSQSIVRRRPRALPYQYLYKTRAHPDIMKFWEEDLEAVRSDFHLFCIARLTAGNPAAEWLGAKVEAGLESEVAYEQARSITLLGFIDDDHSREILSEILGLRSETWLGRVAEVALERWERNRWAQHWYSRFVCEESDPSAWGAFQFFLSCVDGRFWLWKQRLEEEGSLSSERQRFLRLNKDSVRRKIEKRDKDLKETFLGYKKIHAKAWPWVQFEEG